MESHSNFLSHTHCNIADLCHRGMMDESGDQFVAYFIPTDETIKKRKRDDADNIDYADGEE